MTFSGLALSVSYGHHVVLLSKTVSLFFARAALELAVVLGPAGPRRA